MANENNKIKLLLLWDNLSIGKATEIDVLVVNLVGKNF